MSNTHMNETDLSTKMSQMEIVDNETELSTKMSQMEIIDNYSKNIELIDEELSTNSELKDDEIEALIAKKEQLAISASMHQEKTINDRFSKYNLVPLNYDTSRSPILLNRNQQLQICTLYTPDVWNSMSEYDRYCTWHRAIPKAPSIHDPQSSCGSRPGSTPGKFTPISIY
jgi:hypothetical protein